MRPLAADIKLKLYHFCQHGYSIVIENTSLHVTWKPYLPKWQGTILFVFETQKHAIACAVSEEGGGIPGDKKVRR